MPSEKFAGGRRASVVVDGDVDVNGNGDERRNSGRARTKILELIGRIVSMH